jgi:hypothetical protein
MLAAAAAVAFSSLACASSGRFELAINGVPVEDETRNVANGASAAWQVSLGGNDYSATLNARVAAAYAGALVDVSGRVPVQGRVTATTTADYRLKRPTPPIDLAGHRLVLVIKLDGELTGNASADLRAEAVVQTIGDETRAEASRSLANQPGRESLQFDVAVPIPAGAGTAGSVTVTPTFVLTAAARIAGGGAMAASKADIKDSASVVGFRVLNSAGGQVTGFTLSGSRSIPELAPAQPGLALAVEYYNAGFGHYFITANAAEIANLDAGIPAGWQRTGQAFSVYSAPGPGLVAVCRFFSGTSFAPKSSHFYAPRGLGCEALLPTNPVWQFEGDVFYTALPDAAGACPDGQGPVYRLYNNGQGGAPNHRFTTSHQIPLDMIAEGYVAEGAGPGVGMCSPL